MILLKAILIIIICGFFAFGGICITQPRKELEMVVWAIFFSMFVLGFEVLIVYRFHKEKKAEDIKNGKRPIN